MKIFDQQFEGKYQPKRINENLWFLQFQPLLLWMANTPFGRELLCISKNFPVVHEIAKNHIKHVEGDRVLVDFRIGAKWANVIRYRWQGFLDYAAWFPDKTWLLFHVPVYGRVNGVTLTTFPDPDPETTTCDGRSYENYNDAGALSWATIRGNAGNGFGDSDLPPSIVINASTSADLWKFNQRSFYGFDTSSIGSGGTINSATFSIFGVSKLDQGTAITPDINIYGTTSTFTTGLANDTYSAITLNSPTAFSTLISFTNFSTTAYNDFALNASGLADLSKTGISRLVARNVNYDADNVQPTWSNNSSHNLEARFAEQTGTTNDPQLVVDYTAAAATRRRWFRHR